MLDAADHAPDDDDWQAAMAKAYKAMLAVAPAPPRPDASAGLIEAAQIVEDWADATDPVEANLFGHLARYLRARAADRSGR